MGLIAVLLLISFALFVLGRLAETKRMFRVFHCSGMAVCFVVFFSLRHETDSASSAMFGFLLLCFTLSELIAILVLRKRVVSSCVRVKRRVQGYMGHIFLAVMWASFPVFFAVMGDFRSLGRIVFFGLLTISLIILFILERLERIELCEKGVLHDGRLQPWEEYESFSWESQTKDRSELELLSKSLLFRSTRIVVRPEGIDAVQQLLKDNLPDQSVIDIN